MLTKNDIRLFEILDEYIDKSLSFGCNIARYTEEQTKIEWVYLQTIIPNEYTIISKVMQNNWVVHKSEDYEYDIIWHRFTLSTVLRYCFGNNIRIICSEGIIYCEWKRWYTDYTFDITKELKDYSEEEKEKLILFLESIKC